MMSEGVFVMRLWKVSQVSFSAWQSMTVTWCPAFSATAPKYAKPNGMKGGCEWTLGGYGGLTRVSFILRCLSAGCLRLDWIYCFLNWGLAAGVFGFLMLRFDFAFYVGKTVLELPQEDCGWRRLLFVFPAFYRSVSEWDMRFPSHALHSSMLKAPRCGCESMYRLLGRIVFSNFPCEKI